jgi:hypothetical protein
LQARLEQEEDELMDLESQHKELPQQDTSHLSASQKKAHTATIKDLAKQVKEAGERLSIARQSLRGLDPASTSPPRNEAPAAPQRTFVPSMSTAPLPSGLPRFKRPSAQEPNTADDFLSSFERRLRANGYPDERYAEALAACCERAEGNWVSSHLIGKDMTWETIKKKFLQHFVSEDIYQHYEQG